jgi:hypothetical protein
VADQKAAEVVFHNYAEKLLKSGAELLIGCGSLISRCVADQKAASLLK